MDNILKACYWAMENSISIPILLAIAFILAYLVWVWHMIYRSDLLDKCLPAEIVALILLILSILAIWATFFIFGYMA